jgi:hypothetical protein
MNPKKIGDNYIFYKSSLNNGMRVSSEIGGEKYSIKTIPLSKVNEMKGVKTELISYLHEINFDEDMHSLLQTLRMNGDTRKLLILYSK